MFKATYQAAHRTNAHSTGRTAVIFGLKSTAFHRVFSVITGSALHRPTPERQRLGERLMIGQRNALLRMRATGFQRGEKRGG